MPCSLKLLFWGGGGGGVKGYEKKRKGRTRGRLIMRSALPVRAPHGKKEENARKKRKKEKKRERKTASFY